MGRPVTEAVDRGLPIAGRGVSGCATNIRGLHAVRGGGFFGAATPWILALTITG